MKEQKSQIAREAEKGSPAFWQELNPDAAALLSERALGSYLQRINDAKLEELVGKALAKRVKDACASVLVDRYLRRLRRECQRMNLSELHAWWAEVQTRLSMKNPGYRECALLVYEQRVRSRTAIEKRKAESGQIAATSQYHVPSKRKKHRRKRKVRRISAPPTESGSAWNDDESTRPRWV